LWTFRKDDIVMSKTQTSIMWVGLIFSVLVALYPPWLVISSVGPGRHYTVEKPAGYSWVFLPPAGHDSHEGVRIDSVRVGLEYLALVTLFAGVFLTLKGAPPSATLTDAELNVLAKSRLGLVEQPHPVAFFRSCFFQLIGLLVLSVLLAWVVLM